MTDQTTCPHCGAEASCSVLGHTYYGCGSFSHSSGCVQSSHCELTELRAKVAAQQELLRDILKCPASTGTQTVTAVIPFDLWEQLEESI